MYIEQAYKGKVSTWKYLILPIGFMAFIALNYIAVVLSPQSPQDTMAQLIQQIGANATLVMLLAPLAIGFFVVLAWTKLIHQQSITSLTTSRKRIDWRRILFSFFLWGGIITLLTLTAIYLNPTDYQWNFKPISFAILFALALLLFPLQTSFEEYLFRGHMMQGLGVITKNRGIPLIVTSVLFGLMHIGNPEIEKLGYGFIGYYIAVGFFLGIITLMDEGLELALGFHAANNFFSALLLTSTWTALQTDSIYKQTAEPSLGFDVMPLLVVLPILLFVFAKKYRWKDWRNRLFGKVNPPTTDT